MQFELSDLQDKVGITFVTVTHDQDEALSMASRVAVINKGEVAQLANRRQTSTNIPPIALLPISSAR